ncbi:arylamine N-acetyltransferase family protein [Phenylobacterium sp.]|jgi:N-hydroxyarylamine O-acetyltransferase|uniref:arylamine N-acetyltransferase family protein n=1 Tax=Phenylobacterium sp. TaxID=1871053 RepID=UPI002F40EF5C
MNETTDLGRARCSPGDLQRYFDRVGYRGPRAAGVEVLQKLHTHHVETIPFEAIDVLLDRPINLELDVLISKLVHGGRGGYCFEQNLLFRGVLPALGFNVQSLIARSRWGRPLTERRPRTHLALRVRFADEDWLADVGSPRGLLSHPIRLDDRSAQAGRLEAVRLTPTGSELRLEAEGARGWLPVYDLMLAPQHDVDLLAVNWFAATHASSPFRQALIASRALPDGRLTLLENRLTIRRRGSAPEHRRLFPQGLVRSLAEDFGLRAEPWVGMIAAAVARGDRLGAAA